MEALEKINWPKWDVEEPPTNNYFLPLKKQKIAHIMGLLNEYITVVCLLDGINENRDIENVIVSILKDFVTYVYDLPASKSYHHRKPFGLLEHSLDTAYRSAVTASRELAVNDSGVPSAERTREDRFYRTFAAWLGGLFHDIGKIFDMDLRCELSNTDMVYHPMRGGVLDFKLKYPWRERLVLEWRSNRGMLHNKRNAAVFFTLVPLNLIKKFPPHILIRLVDDLYSSSDEADKESVAEERSAEEAEFLKKALKKFASFQFKAGTQQYVTVYKLDDNTFALLSPLFFQKLTELFQDSGSNIENQRTTEAVLKHGNYIYTADSGQFYHTVKVHRIGELRKNIRLTLAFAPASTFEILAVDTSNAPELVLNADEDDKAIIKSILGADSLPDEWFQDAPPTPTGQTDSAPKPGSTNSSEPVLSEKDSEVLQEPSPPTDDAQDKLDPEPADDQDEDQQSSADEDEGVEAQEGEQEPDQPAPGDLNEEYPALTPDPPPPSDLSEAEEETEGEKKTEDEAETAGHGEADGMLPEAGTKALFEQDPQTFLHQGFLRMLNALQTGDLVINPESKQDDHFVFFDREKRLLLRFPTMIKSYFLWNETEKSKRKTKDCNEILSELHTLNLVEKHKNGKFSFRFHPYFYKDNELKQSHKNFSTYYATFKHENLFQLYPEFEKFFSD